MSFEKMLMGRKPSKAILSDGPFCCIDLSVGNMALKEIDGAAAMDHFISNYITANDCKGAAGGYNEERSLYKSSPIFNDSAAPERNIHIGLDIWMKAGTPVLAAVDGIVHSFNYNAGAGNYGPTIILQHRLEEFSFYTLYGHLSIESIEEIEIGDIFKMGQQIGTLGTASVNGNYAPHLHFQIIKVMGNFFGDYPGVCAKSDRDSYLENCPDPNLLLKII